MISGTLPTREVAREAALADALAEGGDCTITLCQGPPACPYGASPSIAECEACTMCERMHIHAQGAA